MIYSIDGPPFILAVPFSSLVRSFLALRTSWSQIIMFLVTALRTQYKLVMQLVGGEDHGIIDYGQSSRISDESS
jgi:hypothetical protein